jgi:hypothetical protein
MPPKGTKVAKPPHSLRTHAKSFPDHVQRQLLLDLNHHGDDKSPAEIVALRPDLYGDSSTAAAKQRRAVRDRIQYIRGLKKTEPAAYW